MQPMQKESMKSTRHSENFVKIYFLLMLSIDFLIKVAALIMFVKFYLYWSESDKSWISFA